MKPNIPRLRKLAATERTARRCVELVQTAPDLLQDSTFVGAVHAIAKEFGLD